MRSFVQYNNDCLFPIQNIPFGVFRNKEEEHICTAIGDFILDLNILEKHGFFRNTSFAEKKVFSNPRLNGFMSLGKAAWSEARTRIQDILNENNPELRDNTELRSECLFPAEKAEMILPVEIGDYTDFYSSKEHASNVGEMFRGKENALMPNWLHIPIAYHGRSSSIILSGKDIIRPNGQTRPDPNKPPVFGPTKQLDFELEMGFFVGNGNELGERISVEKAEDHIFGLIIVNDWSARDIQAWEYQPLGPFLAKNFATSVSPWIVTLDALQPFRTEGPEFEKELLPYLKTNGNPTYDINLEVSIKTEFMQEPFIICKSNYKYLYFNMLQHLTHHTVNGCNARTGDLMASGTISGNKKEMRGSLLELTWRGTEPINLPSGETRKFIEDGDTVIMSAYCEGNGYKIGFGEVRNRILPAKK